jgi:peptidoglycan/LPS O-acetylase OafA/YrhL
MRSSSGEHFISLDHVRALAVFLVFAWHFIHSVNGYPVPFEYVPSLFPLSLINEGHTGVSIFMTLSGYLFSKLFEGKTINYRAFLLNRALRIFPLLSVVILLVGIMRIVRGEDIYAYAFSIAKGALFPSLPNGGWAITVEIHYYLILPLLIWMLRKSKLLPLLIVGTAIALRLLIHQEKGEIQSLAYWTIIGRIDQFALGMIIFQFRAYIAYRNIFVLGLLIFFSLFYWYFDILGGFYQNPTYPSPSLLWVYLPTVEGIAYALAIAWYDNSFSPSTTGASRFIGRIGEYSYSIYLLHFFVVFRVAKFVNERVMDISNFYIACLWAVIIFISMLPIGYLTSSYIEAPLLKFRRRYIVSSH